MSLCNWLRRKIFKSHRRLKANNNHGHELEPSEAGEEATQGNIQGGKAKKYSWKTHYGKGGKRV